MRIPVSQIRYDLPMRADARISNQAVGRYLVLRGMIEPEAFQARAADGVPRAWLAELEAGGLDIEGVRAELWQRVRPAIRHGAAALRVSGFDFIIRDGVLVTVKATKGTCGYKLSALPAKKGVAIREAIS